MGIGTSLGAFFEDDFDHQAGKEYIPPPPKGDEGMVKRPPSTQDKNEVGPDEEQLPRPGKVIRVSDEGKEALPFQESNLSFLKAGKALNSGIDTVVSGIGNFAFNPEETVTNVAKGIGRAFALPGDVLSGKVQAGSVQEIERAADLAGLLISGPAPVASKLADGTLGSFMGVKSQTIDKAKLYKAQELEMNGVHPDKIWEDTGTFRGADNRWRQEINDSSSTLNKKAFDRDTQLHPTDPTQDVETWTLPAVDRDFFGQVNKPIRLPDILDHPELYKAYPELKNMKVMPLPDEVASRGTMAQMDMEHNTMYLGKNLSPDVMKDTIHHELQHQIQYMEDFAKGGNPIDFLPEGFHETKAALFKKMEAMTNDVLSRGITKEEFSTIQRAAKLDLEGNLPKEVKDMIDTHKAKPEYEQIKYYMSAYKQMNAMGLEAHKNYMRLMGEVEARNVEARMALTNRVREATPPVKTEPVPRNEQIGHEGEYGPDLASSTKEPTEFRRAANDNPTPKEQEASRLLNKAKRKDAADKAYSDLQQLQRDLDKKIAARPRIKELSEQKTKMRDVLEKRDWGEIELAKYNKLDKEHHELLGLKFIPQE